MKRLVLLLVLGCGGTTAALNEEEGKDVWQGVFVDRFDDFVLGEVRLEFSGLRDTTTIVFDVAFDVTGRVGNTTLTGTGLQTSNTGFTRIEFRNWTFTQNRGNFGGNVLGDSLVLTGDVPDEFRLAR